MFKWFKRLMWVFLLLSSLGIAAVAAFYFHLEKDLPDVSTLKDTTWETPLRVYSADGKLMSEFGDVKRIPLQLDQIPLQMQHAFLAIEDSVFMNILALTSLVSLVQLLFGLYQEI